MEQEYIDRRDDDDRTSADIIGWAIWNSSGRLSRSCNVEIAKEVYELAQRKRCMEKKYDTFADALEFIRTEIGDLDTVLKIYPELRTVHDALYDELWAFYSVPSTDVNKALEDDSTDDDDDDEEESTVTVVIPDSNAWGAASSSASSCSSPSKKSSSQVKATQKQTTTKKGNTQQRVPQKMTYDQLRAFYSAATVSQLPPVQQYSLPQGLPGGGRTPMGTTTLVVKYDPPPNDPHPVVVGQQQQQIQQQQPYQSVPEEEECNALFHTTKLESELTEWGDLMRGEDAK
mmetsp:Transcript_21613/g.24009  ORF Transcript_21613/g.24009 Transcript_21613/m.24009 type:complete len:287 (-) Transcript_21613:228-1088(-)